MRFFCWTVINLIFGGENFKHLSFKKISSKTGKCGCFGWFFLNTKNQLCGKYLGNIKTVPWKFLNMQMEGFFIEIIGVTLFVTAPKSKVLAFLVNL